MSAAPEISFIDAIAEAVASRLRGEIQKPTIDLDLGIVPMRVYTAREAAEYLGSHVSTVYQISEEELPKNRRAGSGIGYYGINILLYQNGLPPIDIRATLEEYRKALLRDRPAVQALGQQKFTRVQ